MVCYELMAADLSNPVSSIVIKQGTTLQTYAKTWVISGVAEPGLGNFYVKAGTSHRQVGISGEGRHSTLVVATDDIVALLSTASPTKDSWTNKNAMPLMCGGGALQMRLAEGGKEKLKVVYTSEKEF
jgi:hypothetical protein